MDKLNCILDYFCGTKAYYMYWLGVHQKNDEYKELILNKDYMNSACIALISNIMLSIKEDLVVNKGDRIYESKLFVKSLEDSVDFIATKVNNGYKIGNYIFSDAATLVAIVRNKLAHGNFKIDFNHNRIIINHQGNDIVLNIQKLCNFIVMAYRQLLKKTKTTKYERNIVYFDRKNIDSRQKGVKDLTEIRQIIKGYNYLNFIVESLNDVPITEDCIVLFEQFLKYVKTNPYGYQKSKIYLDLCDYLRKRNCKISVQYQKISSVQDINDIVILLGDELLNAQNMPFRIQVELIGREIHKKMQSRIKEFDPTTANVKHLIFLQAMFRAGTINNEILNNKLLEIVPEGVDFYYNEYAMVLISMFNSLFMYPMDDIYSIPGEYTLNRVDGLDFGSLDLSMINPSVISVDYSPLINAKTKADNLAIKCNQLRNKINQQNINLTKVQGKPQAQTKIQNSIVDLNNSLSLLYSQWVVADASYNAILNDFTTNSNYFRNKAIIEGIRNSIAHGHYEIIPSNNFYDSVIKFNDIYEGKLTFQAEIKFIDFERLIGDNTTMIANFIYKKIGLVSGNSLVKK